MEDAYVGDAAQSKRGILAFISWDDMNQIWHTFYDEPLNSCYIERYYMCEKS